LWSSYMIPWEGLKVATASHALKMVATAGNGMVDGYDVDAAAVEAGAPRMRLPAPKD
jgi:hypothetical protein